MKKMVTAYVLTVFAYGLEVVLPTHKHMDKLESEYKRLLINLLGLHVIKTQETASGEKS